MERYVCLNLSKSPEVLHLSLNLEAWEMSYLIWKQEINAPSPRSKIFAKPFQQADLKTE